MTKKHFKVQIRPRLRIRLLSGDGAGTIKFEIGNVGNGPALNITMRSPNVNNVFLAVTDVQAGASILEARAKFDPEEVDIRTDWKS